MSVIAFDRSPEPDSSKPKRHGFWRGLARALDSLAAYPTKHAVSEGELRRVAEDIERCRRLMFKRPQRRCQAMAGREPVHRVAPALKARS